MARSFRIDSVNLELFIPSLGAACREAMAASQPAPRVVDG